MSRRFIRWEVFQKNFIIRHWLLSIWDPVRRNCRRTNFFVRRVLECARANLSWSTMPWSVREGLERQEGFTGNKKSLPFSGGFFKTLYFLWHFPQLAGSFVLKALLPSWHEPQYFPAFMSAIFISVPFFIGKIFVWHSVHFKPLSACTFPSNITFPPDPPAYSTVFPEGTAKTEAAKLP